MSQQNTQMPSVEEVVEAALDILHEAIQHTPIKLEETNKTDYDRGYIFYQDMVVRDVLDNTPVLEKLLTNAFEQKIEEAKREERERIREWVEDQMADLLVTVEVNRHLSDFNSGGIAAFESFLNALAPTKTDDGMPHPWGNPEAVYPTKTDKQ